MAIAAPAQFDRTTEDLGNIVELGHVNVQVTDQTTAMLFYVSGLGLTRDPYMPTMQVDNMWVNVGQAQFHLPTKQPQVLRGVTGLVVPNRDRLLHRLGLASKRLAGTKFRFAERLDHVEITCPWGNRFRVHEPGPRFGPHLLGMPYVAFDVPAGTAEGIVRFYRDLLGARAGMETDAEGPHARVVVGDGCSLLFRESASELAPYDGHHVMISVVDFSRPYRRLAEHKLITSEDSEHQYRFQDIVDPQNGKVLYTVEHEVRSIRHPMYARALVNRNPEQTNRNYAAGRDAFQF